MSVFDLRQRASDERHVDVAALEEVRPDELSAEDVVDCDRTLFLSSVSVEKYDGCAAVGESTEVRVVLLQRCNQDSEDSKLLELVEIPMLLDGVSVTVADHHHQIVFCGESTRRREPDP